MEDVLGKLVARICYTSKKILEDIQSESITNLDALNERFKLCLTDSDKTLQIADALRASPKAPEIKESLLTFKNILLTFETNCCEVLKNKFQFQLRQTMQSSHKELAVQLNIILGKLDSSHSTIKPIPMSTIVSNKARNVAMKIRVVNDLANSGDIEKFVPTARQAFIEMNELQQTLIQMNEELPTSLGRRLGILSIGLIRSAKELCQIPTDETKKDFVIAKQTIAKHLQEILFFAQGYEKQQQQQQQEEQKPSPEIKVEQESTKPTETIEPTNNDNQKEDSNHVDEKESLKDSSSNTFSSFFSKNKKNVKDVKDDESINVNELKVPPKKTKRRSSHSGLSFISKSKTDNKIKELAAELEKKPLFINHANTERRIGFNDDTLKLPKNDDQKNLSRSESSVLPRLNLKEINEPKPRKLSIVAAEVSEV